jgi:radical SAM superfamily enzyme YgiQ (UPF0313 family)
VSGLRIGLVAMSGVRVRTPQLAALGVSLPQFVNRGKVIASLPSLGLLTVAGLTPDDVEVVYREVDELPPEDAELERFDLVGISSYAAQIRDAYLLADRYRALGVPVVLGGLHVSMLPDEAQQHADAVVRYGAEGAWPRLVADFRAGRMKPRYEGLRSGVFDEANYARPRFDLLRGRAYNRVTVQSSRGCPLDCEFCAASLRITSGFQQKPVERVIDEVRRAVAAVERPFLEFADDNTFVNKRWGKELLRALTPLGVRWFTETDVSIADDLELLDLLAESGCRQVLIGFENPWEDGLAGLDAADFKRKRCGRYLESIERIQSRGVSVNGCFIVGLDTHTPDVFPNLKDFIDRSGLLEVQITVLTPFPGTPLYDRLRREDRLLADGDWDRCTLFDVNFVPKRMSVADLEQGLMWLFREVYSEPQYLARQRRYMEIVKTREN